MDKQIVIKILKFSIPVIITNLLQTAYNIVDTFWVGRLGKEAVASVSISTPIIFLLVSLAGGLGIAGSILVSHVKGKNDQKLINHISSQTILIMFISGIVICILGSLLSKSIILLMLDDPNIIENAILYLRYSFISVIPMFLFFSFQSLLRAVGNTKAPMYIVLFSVLLNIILDPILMNGFGLGVEGVAIATLITEIISMVLAFLLLKKGNQGISVKFKNIFKPDFTLIKKIIKLGFPTSIEQISRSFSNIVIMFIVTGLGINTIASHGISGRIFGFILIPALGFSIAGSNLIGHSLGAENPKEAKEIANHIISISAIFVFIFSIFTFIFANTLAAIFIPNDPIVIKTSGTILRYMSVIFPLIAIQISIFGILRGSGYTKKAMALSITTSFIPAIFIFFLTKKITPDYIGLSMSYPIAEVISLALVYIVYKRTPWETRKITKEMEIEINTEEEMLTEVFT